MITFSRRFKNRFKKKRVFRQPRRWKGVFSIFLVVLAGILLIFLITLNLKIGQERAKLQRELANIQGELQKSQEGREESISKLSKAQSGDYMEKVAREDLNLQKEGEKVVAFSVVEGEAKEEEEIEEKDFLEKKFPYWIIILVLMGGTIIWWIVRKLKIR